MTQGVVSLLVCIKLNRGPDALAMGQAGRKNMLSILIVGIEDPKQMQTENEPLTMRFFYA